MNDLKPDSEQSPPHDHTRVEKRLARGLEDVSALFLSQAHGESGGGGETAVKPVEQPPSRAAEPAFTTLLHPSPGVSRERLVSLLEDHVAVLEEGVRTIDVNIPCDPHGSIDLLAVDRSNHLILIDLDESVRDDLLLRGICHFDWLVRNVPVLRRMYRGHVIDYSTDPRIFLVAPGFPPLVKCAVRCIARPRVLCFRQHAVSVRDGAGILFECA